MAEVDAAHRPCEFLETESQGLPDDRVFRFVLGDDDGPVPLDAETIDASLGDRFAELVLRQASLPRTAEAVLAAITAAAPAGDPLLLQRFFLVGEDGQLLRKEGETAVPRSLRFLVTCGHGPDGPDIIMSAFNSAAGTVELMAWDHRTGGFNYYRTVDRSTAWAFAGNSRHALTAPTRDNGPFESHKAGHLLMKELRSPWVHWHSPKARVVPAILDDAGLRDHPWIDQLDAGGAYTFEDDVVKPAIGRWTRSRMDALVEGRAQETPRRILEQLLDTPTVNLITSSIESSAAHSGAAKQLLLPETFFVDAVGLEMVSVVRQPGEPPLPDDAPKLAALEPPAVDSAFYRDALDRFGFRLQERGGFRRAGDTHFAFAVPERAFEDVDTLRQAIERGILTRRLVAAFLMVDFPNPVYSSRRRGLLDHVPDEPFADDSEGFAERVVDEIRRAPAASEDGSAEQEFLARWDVGEPFFEAYDALLVPYYAAISERLASQEGFDPFVLLAESRRQRTRSMPIAGEFDLLFATTDIPSAERQMTVGARVEEV
ncbi:MAG: hypothetical protein M3P50_10815 [Actinomycetota bacterium]|nr:hypothetical protein [Actinomycetota bacterium]